MSFDEKKYELNGEPASARDLIFNAGLYCERFRYSKFKTTSQAAAILRENGNTVAERAP